MKKHLWRIVVGLAIVGIFFSHERGDFKIPLLHKFEDIAYDMKLLFAMPGGVDPKVVSKLGVTALDIAREFKNEAAIALLAPLTPARK